MVLVSVIIIAPYILEEDFKKCKDNFNILMYIINQILKRKIVNQILLLMINQILKRKIVKRKILKRKIVKQILKRKTVKRKIMPILVRKKINPILVRKKMILKSAILMRKKNDIKKYNKPSKTLNSIEKIIKRFMCEKFMDEKYYVKTDKDKIVFYLICKPIKGFKMKHMIEISKDVITLAIEKETKTMNEVITICIIANQIKLDIAQTENQNKNDISISYLMMKSYLVFQ